MDIWEKFLASILPDPAMRLFVQRLVGYGYLAEIGEPVMAVFAGPPATGKSTLTRALYTALGINVVERCPEFAPRHFTIVNAHRMLKTPGSALLVPFGVQIAREDMDRGMLMRLCGPEVQAAIRDWAYAGYLDFVKQGLNPPAGVLAL